MEDVTPELSWVAHHPAQHMLTRELVKTDHLRCFFLKAILGAHAKLLMIVPEVHSPQETNLARIVLSDPSCPCLLQA